MLGLDKQEQEAMESKAITPLSVWYIAISS